MEFIYTIYIYILHTVHTVIKFVAKFGGAASRMLMMPRADVDNLLVLLAVFSKSVAVMVVKSLFFFSGEGDTNKRGLI